MPDLLTVKEAACVLRCHPDTLRRKIRRGRMPGVVDVDGLVRIDRAVLCPGEAAYSDVVRQK